MIQIYFYCHLLRPTNHHPQWLAPILIVVALLLQQQQQQQRMRVLTHVTDAHAPLRVNTTFSAIWESTQVLNLTFACGAKRHLHARTRSKDTCAKKTLVERVLKFKHLKKLGDADAEISKNLLLVCHLVIIIKNEAWHLCFQKLLTVGYPKFEKIETRRIFVVSHAQTSLNLARDLNGDRCWNDLMGSPLGARQGRPLGDYKIQVQGHFPCALHFPRKWRVVGVVGVVVDLSMLAHQVHTFASMTILPPAEVQWAG